MLNEVREFAQKYGERARESMQKGKYINISYIKRILFFGIIGFILGSTLGVFFLPQYKEQYMYMQKQLYTSVSGMCKNDLSYFLFCISDYVKQMILIILFTFTIFFGLYGKMLFIWKGIIVGFVFSTSVKCYGAAGWFLFCVNWFPQGIFYMLSLIIQLSLCYSIREEYLGSQIKIKGHIAKWSGFFFLCLVCIIIGGYLESGVNLDLLKNVLEKCINQK